MRLEIEEVRQIHRPAALSAVHYWVAIHWVAIHWVAVHWVAIHWVVVPRGLP